MGKLYEWIATWPDGGRRLFAAEECNLWTSTSKDHMTTASFYIRGERVGTVCGYVSVTRGRLLADDEPGRCCSDLPPVRYRSWRTEIGDSVLGDLVGGLRYRQPIVDNATLVAVIAKLDEYEKALNDRG